MALGVRDPGYLPNVLARVEKTRLLLSKGGLEPDLREAIEGILALATTQHELNKRLWEGKKGFPHPHAETHTGSGGDPFPAGTVPSMKRIELDFETPSKVERVFTVIDVDVLPASKIVMNHSGAAATGKQADEAEFDIIDCRCEPGVGQFTVYATSLLGHVLGTFKFDYVLQ